MDVSRAVLTDHAVDRLARRGIDPESVQAVLTSPGQVLPDSPGRVVAQSLVDDGTHLLRVFVDIDREPPEVVSAYLTSKISKYWSGP